MSSVTPVWNDCTCVVATVPVPPPVVVRMLTVSPARSEAVRPETVVKRGSSRMRALLLEMRKLSTAVSEYGLRISGEVQVRDLYASAGGGVARRIDRRHFAERGRDGRR